MWGSTEEPIIYFGFDAPKEIKIVRENALRKTRDDD
jgi:sRNA-binding carbon storage regulator CsrA